MVAVVGNEDDLLERAEGLDAERAGSVGLARPVVGIALDLLAVDHVGDGVGELLEEVADGLGELDAEGVLVDDLDAADVVGAAVELVAHADDVTQVVEDGGGEVGGVGGAFEAVLDVLGGDAAAVVEDDVVAQEEGVDEAALGDLPALGDVGDDLEVEVEADEATEDLSGVLGGAGVADLDGVEDGGRVVAEGDEAVLAADTADGAVALIVALVRFGLAGVVAGVVAV